MPKNPRNQNKTYTSFLSFLTRFDGDFSGRFRRILQIYVVLFYFSHMKTPDPCLLKTVTQPIKLDDVIFINAHNVFSATNLAH